MSEWIYEFKGRNGSSSIHQNFLWNTDNVYIMDNHRAALWCWLQHVDMEKEYGLFHIDAHYDMARTLSPEVISTIPDLTKISFNDYLDIKQPNITDDVPLLRWDNYLTLFVELYNKQIGDFFTATHKIGQKPPSTIQWEEIEIQKLPEIFNDFLNEFPHSGWILNLDLDYFFARQPNDLDVFLNDTYIEEIFTSINKAYQSGIITVLTICLSPECTGGWSKSEQICQKLCNTLGLDFKLPDA